MTDQMTNLQRSRAWARCSTCALVVAWLGAIACGWWFLEAYAYSVNKPPGLEVVESWPAASMIERAPGQPVLLFFVHPKCPCTQASLTELDRLLTSLENSSTPLPKTVVVATVPLSADSSWLTTTTLERAELMPQAQIFVDEAGRESARFGAATSGLVMLFDESGKRVFTGGVTASRGHEGPNLGCEKLASILKGEAPTTSDTPAFGCRLCLPDDALNQQRPLHAVRDEGKTSVTTANTP